MRVYPSIDFLETNICFLAEVDVFGTVYYFSSFPIVLSVSGGGEVLYTGGLSDPEYYQGLEEIGQIKLSQDSVAMSLRFPFDVARRQMLGKGIENAVVTISYVTTKKRKSEQTFDERIPIFKGIIREPVYGYPGLDSGTCDFSVENEIFVSDSSLLRMINQDLTTIGQGQFSRGNYEGGGLIESVISNGLLSAEKKFEGKIVPAVIGSPGKTTRPDGTTTNYPSTPAYIIALDASSPPVQGYFVIAGHPTEADTITFEDNNGNINFSVAVNQAPGAKGQVFSYVKVSANDIDIDVNKENLQYFCRWVGTGGGAISPYTGDTLSGGGDLLYWALSSLGVLFDRSAFESVRGLLNQYKFDGYINDPSIKIYEFLQKYIIPVLPVTIANGAEGLYPIIDWRLTDNFSPRIEIETSEVFKRIKPVETRSTNIINDLTIQYASGFVRSLAPVDSGQIHQIAEGSEYHGTVYIRDKRNEDAALPYEIVSPYSIQSVQRYGRQEGTLSLEYVHDRDTAIKIGMDLIRRKALPEKRTQYQAAFSFGYLRLGDVISLTDPDLGLESAKVQIVGKTYDGAAWLYDVMYQETTIDLSRTTT